MGKAVCQKMLLAVWGLRVQVCVLEQGLCKAWVEQRVMFRLALNYLLDFLKVNWFEG